MSVKGLGEDRDALSICLVHAESHARNQKDTPDGPDKMEKVRSQLLSLHNNATKHLGWTRGLDATFRAKREDTHAHWYGHAHSHAHGHAHAQFFYVFYIVDCTRMMSSARAGLRITFLRASQHNRLTKCRMTNAIAWSTLL